MVLYQGMALCMEAFITIPLTGRNATTTMHSKRSYRMSFSRNGTQSAEICIHGLRSRSNHVLCTNSRAGRYIVLFHASVM